MDPGTARYYEDRHKRRREVAASLTTDEWRRIAAPLAAEAKAKVFGAGSATIGDAEPSLDVRLVDGWCLARQQIRGTNVTSRSTDATNDVTSILLDWIGQSLADELASEPDKWVMAIERTKPWEVVVAFVEAIPTELVRLHVAVLIEASRSKGLLDMIELMDVGRKERAQVADWIGGLVNTAEEPWAQADALDRLADAAIPQFFIRQLSRLLERAGTPYWWEWVKTLEPGLRAMILNDVDNLDFVEGILSHTISIDAGELDRILVVRRLLELWKRIDTNLKFAARYSGNGPDVAQRLAKQEADLQAWRDVELEVRMQRVAEILAADAAAVTVHAFLVNVFGRDATAQISGTSIEGRIRKVILKQLLVRKKQAILAGDLVAGGVPRPAALLSASLVLFLADNEDPNAIASVPDTVLGGYEKWLASDSIAWSQPLVDDEFEMAWTLAGVLANHKEPTKRWRSMEDEIPIQTEGWGTLQDRPTDDICARAHLFVVGAMASEWLEDKKRHADAAELLDVVWHALHSWIRTLASMIVVDYVSAALVHTWARMNLVFVDRASSYAIAQVPLVDRLEWLVHCAEVFRDNYGRRGAKEPLPKDLRAALRARFDVMIPVWERRHTVGPETRKGLVDRMDSLTSGPDGD
jgi:hypothetical protein